MTRMVMVLMVLTVIGLALVVCKKDKPKTVTVTDKDAGSMVELNKGDVLEVILVGNPSTGFTWEPQTFDAAVIKQQGEMSFKADRDEPGFAGSPGKCGFRFEALGKGQTELLLVYHQPWMKDTPPVQTYKLTVNVE